MQPQQKNKVLNFQLK